MRFSRRSCCSPFARGCCSLRSILALITMLYTLAFLYSITNSHYRVLYLSAREIYNDAQAARHTGVRSEELNLAPARGVAGDAGAGRSRRLLQSGGAATGTGTGTGTGTKGSYEGLLGGRSRHTETDKRPLCEPPLSELDYVRVNAFVELNVTDVKRDNPAVQRGGWKPSNCRSVQKVAIVIPHRNRHHHLALLLHRLHPLMQLQQIEYRIFVIEQLTPEEFNRGMLLNVGFLEALALDPSFDCFVFQDVDLIPEHFQNLYMCTDQIHHLASAIDEMRFHVMFYNYAGGVVAVNKRNFVKVNGYANNYWGWGNEDDDFSARTLESGLMLTRPLERIGRYKMVKHKKAARSESGNSLFMNWRDRWSADGIQSLAQHRPYTVQSVEFTDLYVNISVALDRQRTSLLRPDDALGPGPTAGPTFWAYVQNLLFFLRFYFP